MDINIQDKPALDLVNSKQNSTVEPKQKSVNDDREKIKKAAQGFEAIFVQHLLRTMRQSISKSGLFGDGISGDLYSSMFNEKIAEVITIKGGIGLADNIIKALENKSQITNFNMDINTENSKYFTLSRPNHQKVDNNWDRSIIDDAADHFDIEPKLIEAVIKVESNANKNAISNKGAAGLMQLMEGTARQLGVRNRFDPRENIFGGVKYLKSLLQRFNGDLEMALSAYNAGPTAVEKYKGIPPFPETQRYVQKVITAYQEK